MQYFKENDLIEKKVVDSASPALDLLSNVRDDFYDGAFTCYLLGDILYELNRDPMSGVITQQTFRVSFPAIHDLFTRAGTFEFYLEVFRAIWGPDVEVEFEIPSNGVLLINIKATNTELAFFMAREIVSENYVYSEVVTEDNDNIMFQIIKGIKTQREVDALINELSPAGLWVRAELEIG